MMSVIKLAAITLITCMMKPTSCVLVTNWLGRRRGIDAVAQSDQAAPFGLFGAARPVRSCSICIYHRQPVVKSGVG